MENYFIGTGNKGSQLIIIRSASKHTKSEDYGVKYDNLPDVKLK
jgi:hypothetical protein